MGDADLFSRVCTEPPRLLAPMRIEHGLCNPPSNIYRIGHAFDSMPNSEVYLPDSLVELVQLIALAAQLYYRDWGVLDVVLPLLRLPSNIADRLRAKQRIVDGSFGED
jgi:hypothetical protein